jgi:hypothetical protein
MQWEWEAISELPITSPHQRYGNWETADGMRFFCQWVEEDNHEDNHREDALRGNLICHLDGDHDECALRRFLRR